MTDHLEYNRSGNLYGIGPSAAKAVQALEDEDMVKGITGRRRGKIYSYHEYMDIMNEGTALR